MTAITKELGALISSEVGAAGRDASKLIEREIKGRERLLQLRSRPVFNSGRSSEAGAEALRALAA